MEVNKAIGYLEITVGGKIIPVKMGAFALEHFSELYPIPLRKIGEVFDIEKFTGDDGKESYIEFPKEMLKFLRIALLSGANYMQFLEGKPYYTMADAYQWVDEIGFGSDKTGEVIAAFQNAIRNGAMPITQLETDKISTKKKVQKRVG